MKNIKICMKVCILIFTALICLVKTDIIKDAVSDALGRCLNIIIPSLYAMMIISPLLIKSGINATIRRTLGQDIDAACGQLRRAECDAGIRT